MALLDMALLQYQSMQFMPSHLAAAAVYLTMKTDQFLLEQLSNLDFQQLLPCIRWMETCLVCYLFLFLRRHDLVESLSVGMGRCA